MEVEKTKRFDQEILSSLTQYTLPQILFKQAERLGQKKIAIREKMYGIRVAYSWEDYLRYTKHAVLGFIALGLKRGENIGIITDNHPEWLFSEMGAQAIGAITVNLFTSSIAKELTTMLNRIQAAYVVPQDQELNATTSNRSVLRLRHPCGLTLVCRILKGSRTGPGFLMSLSHLQLKRTGPLTS